MKIRIRLENNMCMPEQHGDWCDLKSACTVKLETPYIIEGKETESKKKNVAINSYLLSLGVAMEIPKGFEAIVLPRSSNPKHWGIALYNSAGVIDNNYCGNNDIWRFNAVCLRRGQYSAIQAGDRIAQFRIQLKQNATFLQKLRWLFWNGKIEFVVVHDLGNKNRGGIGSTGK